MKKFTIMLLGILVSISCMVSPIWAVNTAMCVHDYVNTPCGGGITYPLAPTDEYCMTYITYCNHSCKNCEKNMVMGHETNGDAHIYVLQTTGQGYVWVCRLCNYEKAY